jgi:hypothetical protein
MKCIKAVKPTKHVKVGEMKRVQDKDADLSVKDGYWQYTSKSEWKSYSKPQSEGINKSK